MTNIASKFGLASGGTFSNIDYTTSDYYPDHGVVDCAARAGASITANILYLFPFVPAFTHTFNRIAIENNSSVNGHSFRLGIYSSSGRKPSGAALLDAGAITVADVNTNTVREKTISQSLTAGTMYWLAVVGDSASSLWCRGAPANLNSYIYFGEDFGTANNGAVNFGYKMTHAYAALPTIGTLTKLVTATNACPIIYLRA